MKRILAALAVAVLAAPAAKAERWVTYGDAIEVIHSRERALAENAEGNCIYYQVDLDSVTRRGVIVTFNDRIYSCKYPERSRLQIGKKQDCTTGASTNPDGTWSPWVEDYHDPEMRKALRRRMELTCR